MDEIDRILQNVRQTNPGMSREKLVFELSQCTYTAKSLIYSVNYYENATQADIPK